MKKTLATLGLLICTSGLVYANDTVTVDTPIQATETQPQIEKQLPAQRQFNNYKNGPEFKNFDNQKFDKSVKNQKFDPKKADKTQKFKKIGKGDVKNKKYDIRNDKFNPNFKPKNANMYRIHHHHYVSHYPRHSQKLRAHNHRHYDIKNYKTRNHKMHNRSAYNRSAKIR